MRWPKEFEENMYTKFKPGNAYPFLDYAMSVIVSTCIGLMYVKWFKAVSTVEYYTEMSELGRTPDKAHKKSATYFCWRCLWVSTILMVTVAIN